MSTLKPIPPVVSKPQLIPAGFVKVEFQGQEIPEFLECYRDFVNRPENADLKPEFERTVCEVAQVFGVSVHEILASLDGPAYTLSTPEAFLN